MKSNKDGKFTYKIYQNVLSRGECNSIIEQSLHFKESKTTGNTSESDTTYRKSSTAVFSSELSQITKLRNSFASLTNTDILQQETPISVIKYSENDYYLPHLDSFGGIGEFPNPEAGDRLISGILYLNDDYIGGETFFKYENIKAKGNQGDLLLWYNLNKNGSPNRNTLHEGLPVINGVKYIVVIWAREKEFTNQIKKVLI